MNEDTSRTIFIHVPDVAESSADHTAKSIAEAICIMYKQIKEKDDLLDSKKDYINKDCVNNTQMSEND